MATGRGREDGQTPTPATPAQLQTLPGSLREVIERASAPAPVVDDQPPKAPRRRRKAAPEPEPESAVVHPETASTPPRPAAAEVSESNPTSTTKVDRSSRQKLRQAIIYHEIFGKPKSLRKGDENWDQK